MITPKIHRRAETLLSFELPMDARQICDALSQVAELLAPAWAAYDDVYSVESDGEYLTFAVPDEHLADRS